MCYMCLQQCFDNTVHPIVRSMLEVVMGVILKSLMNLRETNRVKSSIKLTAIIQKTQCLDIFSLIIFIIPTQQNATTD